MAARAAGSVPSCRGSAATARARAAAQGGRHSLSRRPAPLPTGIVLATALAEEEAGQVTAEGAATQQAAAPAASAAAGDLRTPASAAAAPQPAPPSRLQQEAGLLVALDVEYTHLQLAPGGRHVSLPAEVCAVDAGGAVLLHQHCNPLVDGRVQQGRQLRRWRHVGGQPPEAWQAAPALAEVRSELAALLEGRVLVGHHCAKDLAALGLSHPKEAIRDTLQYRQLRGGRRSGRRLRDLSADKLGRSIQAEGRPHCPLEDARAAMDLYLRFVHFDERNWRYEDVLEAELGAILSSAGSVDGSMDGSMDGSGEESEDGSGEDSLEVDGGGQEEEEGKEDEDGSRQGSREAGSGSSSRNTR